ncbi:hypothetical protein BS47DRAFT_1379288 [Hydnum rufescens UP504]|uniref:ZZ-type domain-containing protein n=1 Tax=Hydnum rufescens UP504 TaxID=1448309 RepID=A0A9P6DYH6_9AGAM|nr:hypothetical protein BS47DRAFT_1379288 [Hydnum rufescens UP504]
MANTQFRHGRMSRDRGYSPPELDGDLERPDKPLVVKCAFDRSLRRITFASAKHCSFNLLRTRVEQCFALSASSFTMSYQDDDGETTDIISEHDLTEAIQYFQAGGDDHGASGGSVFSGYSGRVSRKITLRITVMVEYDGPSLSDTASLVSLEDYPRRDANSQNPADDSFSHFSSTNELEDDMVTISSHDPAFGPSPKNVPHSVSRSLADISLKSSIHPSHEPPRIVIPPEDTQTDVQDQSILSGTLSGTESPPPISSDNPSTTPTKVASSSLIFERLKLAEAQSSPQNLHSSERGAKWLREQNDRAIRTMMGTLPEPSDAASSSAASENYQGSLALSSTGNPEHGDERDPLPTSGGLALQQDTRGKYYYTYTSDASSRTEGESDGPDRPESMSYSADDEWQPIPGPSRPNSNRYPPSMSDPFGTDHDRPSESNSDLSPELLQAILQSEAHNGPPVVTECSCCGDILDSFRYVCSTCGEKKAKTRDEISLARSLSFSDAENVSGDGNSALPSIREPGAEAQAPSSINAPNVSVFDYHESQVHLLEDDFADIPSNASSFAASSSSLGLYSPPLPPRPSSPGPTPPVHPAREHLQHLPTERQSVVQSATYITTGLTNLFGGRNRNDYPLSNFFKRGALSISSSGGASNRRTIKRPHSAAVLESSEHSGQSRYPPHPPFVTGPLLPSRPPPPPPKPTDRRHGSRHHSSNGTPPGVALAAHTRDDDDTPLSPAGSSGTTSTVSTKETGYELCAKCLESAGVSHAEGALNVSVTTPSTLGLASSSTSPINGNVLTGGSPIGHSPPVDPSASTVSSGRKVKRKGQIRHAYAEKIWGVSGWTDVELDDGCNCSICNKRINRDRFKCASCEQFNLCRACYSQVHEIHPAHAFLAIPDRTAKPLALDSFNDDDQEKSMKHPGVTCSHCLQDIVGARFHCALCDNVDICSNCESAGLPGNLTSPDGGHDSSHIMIKIPVPLETTEVQTASRRARALWTGRDAPALDGASGGGRNRSRANSFGSSYQQTVVGVSHSGGGPRGEKLDHHISCRSCHRSIIGTRYQCASCHSVPSSYSLCSDCEKTSFAIHDAMHVFIKIPRPVDRPIESPLPLLVPVYDVPAGQDRDGNRYGENFKEYLAGIVHSAAICDRCIEPIHGEWFRCAHCDADFCEDCEAIGVHDSRHVFIVLKSSVDMFKFRRAVDLDNTHRRVGVLNHVVYAS